jgi:hypothetical protein
MARLDLAARSVRRRRLRVQDHGNRQPDRPVQIDSVVINRVTVAPPRGLAIAAGVGGQPVTVRHVRVSLDDPAPITTYGDDGQEQARSFGFVIGRQEREVFHLVATTHASRVEWTAELVLLVDGRRRRFRISDSGASFRTSGSEGLDKYFWSGSAWRKA